MNKVVAVFIFRKKCQHLYHDDKATQSPSERAIYV